MPGMSTFLASKVIDHLLRAKRPGELDVASRGSRSHMRPFPMRQLERVNSHATGRPVD